MLVLVIIFIFGNLKNCLMKILQLLLQLIVPLIHLSTKTRVEVRGSYLKQDKITYDYGIVVNIYIVYEINKTFNIGNYPVLENCIFGADSWTKNHDIDKSKYSGYGIGFDRKDFFHTLEVKLVETV